MTSADVTVDAARIDSHEMNEMLKRGLLLGAVLVASGCFKYVPTQLEAMPQGENVRLFVTRQGALELAEVREVDGSIPSLTGRLVSQEDREVLIQVPVAERREGFHSVDLTQTIRVPAGEIISVERRQFDPLGTGLLAGGTAALGAMVVYLIIDAYGGPPRPGEIPPDELRHIDLFSIPIG